MADVGKETRQRVLDTANSLRRKLARGTLSAQQTERLEAIGLARQGDVRVALAIARPDLADEWHPTKNGRLTPFNVTVGTSRKVWWRHWHKESGAWHEWPASVASRARQGNGCPYCANMKTLAGFNDLATVRPGLAAEWHPTRNGDLTPSEVRAVSGKKAWWRHWHEEGGTWHEWLAEVAARTLDDRGCPYCSGRRVLAGFNDLATTLPDLAAEWHPTKNGDLKPSDVMAGSMTKAWWLCHEGHEWQTAVLDRAKSGTGCPVCSNRLVIAGFNDLATTRPDLAAEWHPTKNGDLKPSDVMAGSMTKAWWLCHEGHEWQTAVLDRAKSGTGCPVCSNRLVIAGFNDLATTRPDLAAEWHPTKNGDLKPCDVVAGSTKRVWWKCSVDGHEWSRPVFQRTRKEGLTGCPVCGNRRRGRAQAKPVVCVETGERYDSLTSAGRAMGGKDGKRVWACLNGNAKTAYGHHWRYVDEKEVDTHD